MTISWRKECTTHYFCTVVLYASLGVTWSTQRSYRIMASRVLSITSRPKYVGRNVTFLYWSGTWHELGVKQESSITWVTFLLYRRKPIGCVLFKQYVDGFANHPGLFQACKFPHPYLYFSVETSKWTQWTYLYPVSTGSRHYIGIYFLTTEDFALAYYKDNFKHPTYIMTMLMGVWVCENWSWCCESLGPE